MKFHKKCAKSFGTFEGQIPMPIKRRVEFIDPCIADIIASLNAGNVLTTASCCGHDKKSGDIILDDGRILHIEYPKQQKEDDDERKNK